MKMRIEIISRANRLVRCSLLFYLLTFLLLSLQAQPKREFRGAWIQAVNGQWVGMSTQQMQQTLRYQLNALQQMGANAIIFQVRPECDSL